MPEQLPSVFEPAHMARLVIKQPYFLTSFLNYSHPVWKVRKFIFVIRPLNSCQMHAEK